jgi:hypothetical protein
MESKKLSARVVAYRDAINAAREAGVTWAQLSALFGADAKYFAAVCKTIDKSRYKACEQLPLPEAVQQKNVKAVNASSIVQTANKRPLPSVTRKISDGSNEDRLARLRALGIDVSSMEDGE